MAFQGIPPAEDLFTGVDADVRGAVASFINAYVAQMVERYPHIERYHTYKNDMDTNLLGTITELKCKTYFLELGYIVSTPDSPARYDFILDIGDKLLKIQVKTSHID